MLYLFLAVLIILLAWMAMTDPWVVAKVEAGWEKMSTSWNKFQNFSTGKRRIILFILILIIMCIIGYLYFD